MVAVKTHPLTHKRQLPDIGRNPRSNKIDQNELRD